MIVQKINQEDEDFWQLMGRHFASAKVKRDLGVAMSSDESYTWLLAMEKGRVVGFCAIVPVKDYEQIKHLYSIDGDAAVLSKILKVVAKGKQPKRAIVSPEELPVWESQGFTKTGKLKGRYIEVERA
jgi:hypothetical protein